MLRRAKTFSADSSVINETLVEALAREHPPATKGSAKMPETLIAKGTVHQTNVVPEIPRCPRNQIPCRCRRVSEMPLALGHEAKRFQGGQQCNKPVLRDAGYLCQDLQ